MSRDICLLDFKLHRLELLHITFSMHTVYVLWSPDTILRGYATRYLHGLEAHC